MCTHKGGGREESGLPTEAIRPFASFKENEILEASNPETKDLSLASFQFKSKHFRKLLPPRSLQLSRLQQGQVAAKLALEKIKNAKKGKRKTNFKTKV